MDSLRALRNVMDDAADIAFDVVTDTQDPKDEQAANDICDAISQVRTLIRVAITNGLADRLMSFGDEP